MSPADVTLAIESIEKIILAARCALPAPTDAKADESMYKAQQRAIEIGQRVDRPRGLVRAVSTLERLLAAARLAVPPGLSTLTAGRHIRAAQTAALKLVKALKNPPAAA